MLKAVLVLVATAIAGFAGYVAMQPPGYTVTRQATIAAPPAVIYPHIANLKRWDDWSPWAKKDPNAKVQFSGPESGVGSKFTWSGNSDVGAGAMTIVESTPDQRVAIKLDLTAPIEGTSDVVLALQPEGGGRTSVRWSIAGQQGFIDRAFCTLLGIDLDEMIGTDYEKGLANLKNVVEAAPRADANRG
ncbi:MAG: SRPBCC family protein [Hyphomicrobiaceae bacterium]|nr:SRPBCC family protein [Hyphomicrobiaceae bacterium]